MKPNCGIQEGDIVLLGMDNMKRVNLAVSKSDEAYSWTTWDKSISSCENPDVNFHLSNTKAVPDGGGSRLTVCRNVKGQWWENVEIRSAVDTFIRCHSM